MKIMTALIAAFAICTPVHAGTTAMAGLPAGITIIAAADTAMSEGEIRKIDPSTRKITIKHGELKNLDMPAMTMVFQVKDPAMLEQVQSGDKVRFRADKVNGAFIVTEIEVVK
ncbi:MAG: copper-binding protein [Betaproteobacteria bacterium]